MAKRLKKLILNGEAYELTQPVPVATSSTSGTVKLGSDTAQSVAANAVSSTDSRTYALQVNSSGQGVVNVPWENTTYTASSFDIKDLTDSTGLRTTWSGKQDALTAGSNISITTVDDTLTISATDTTYSTVSKSDMDTGTGTTAGVVTAKDLSDFVNGKITNTYVYKGTKATYGDLPSTGNTVGDVWNITAAHTTDPKFPAGSNVAWDGTGWDVLGGVFDTSTFVDTSTNQTVGGTKTFTTSPVVPSKTADATNTGTAIATEAQVYKKLDSSSLGNATITFYQGISSTATGTLTTNQSSAGSITFHDNVVKTQTEYDNLPASKSTDGNSYWIYETVS